MHFELRFDGDKLLVGFASSKEEIVLGELSFVDDAGCVRTDVRELFVAALQGNPLFTVTK